MLRVNSSRMSNMIWPWQSFGAHQQPRDLADKKLCICESRESFASKLSWYSLTTRKRSEEELFDVLCRLAQGEERPISE